MFENRTYYVERDDELVPYRHHELVYALEWGDIDPEERIVVVDNSTGERDNCMAYELV